MSHPFNANPNYSMNERLLIDINSHLDLMFDSRSKLLPFRMDFSWRKGTPRFESGTLSDIQSDINKLVASLPTGTVEGYYWVTELADSKHHHIHAVFYVNGQAHQKSYPISRLIGGLWQKITNGDGFFHICEPQDKFEFNLGKVVDHRDETAIDGIRYVISYLAKDVQKPFGVISGCNVPLPPSGRGRPRDLLPVD